MKVMKKSRIAKLWHDPVWSKVIAVAGISILGAIWSYFQGLWPAIGAPIAYAMSWTFKQRTPIPNWLLILLYASGVATVVIVAIRVWAVISPAGWRSYVEDEFFGVRWRWRYGHDGGVYDLHSFCPVCDYQVYAANASYFRTAPRIEYRCENCGGRVLAGFDGVPEEVENRVIRHVQQKLRTSSWPKAADA
jgi:hypothetical protein